MTQSNRSREQRGRESERKLKRSGMAGVDSLPALLCTSLNESC